MLALSARLILIITAIGTALALLLMGIGDDFLYHTGDVIAFTSIAPESDLYLLDVPREITHRLTHSRIVESGVRWSPDGQQLAYISGFYEIHLTDISGRNRRPLRLNNVYIRSLAWSGDGQHIFFTVSQNRDIRLESMTPTGDDVRPVSSPPLDYYDLVWSPDGQRLTFASLHEGDHDIYVMDWARDTVQRLTERRAIDVSPTWSPDGRAIAYTSVRSGQYEIDVADLISGQTRQIEGIAAPVRTPLWIGDTIYYASGSHIYTMNTDGSQYRVLIDVGIELAGIAVRP